MSTITLGLLSLLYLAFLFLIATWAESRGKKKKSLINNSYIYSLTLAIYCTAWTYYGSVGRVITNGLDFLAIYLGPTLFMFLGWSVLRKIIRICKIQRITSIADFISTRYGKSNSLGSLVTIVCLFAAIPYIGLQIKAIANSFSILTYTSNKQLSFFNDSSFYIVLILIVFTILFGTRRIEEDEKHEGMVFSIAIESIIKLVVFLTIGIFITFFIYNGFTDLSKQLPSLEIKKIFDIKKTIGYNNWFWHIFLSFGAFILLPRQFQVAVVENNDEEHLSQAMWMFPLYVLLINIFVVPLAIAGEVIIDDSILQSDMFVLGLPMHFNNNILAFFVYIGGFSAATSMIIVETIAISVMVSNNLLMPLLLNNAQTKTKVAQNPIAYIQANRRIAIVFLILFGYIYYKYLSDKSSLVSIGMIAFVAVFQFAPATFGGIFWKTGNKTGATTGLIAGISIWFILLILPTISDAGIFYKVIPIETLLTILFSIAANLNITDLDVISNATFWTISVNSILYYFVSINTTQSSSELNQAALFVDVFKYSQSYENSVVWRGKAKINDITELLRNFIGIKKSDKLLIAFAEENNLDLKKTYADSQVVNYVEKILSGFIGNTSARMMVSSVTKEEAISFEDMATILKESQELVVANLQLKDKTEKLKIISARLKETNHNLLRIDQIKDDFLTTVTHEIRTPLTSIKALSEILYDNEDLEGEEKRHFLETIINESDRMGRLINQVLDLEKYESGKRTLEIQNIDLTELLKNASATLRPQLDEKGVNIRSSIEPNLPVLIGDYDKIVQVFLNIISNAIKFVKPHTGIINVSISSNKLGFNIIISDNGVGIDAVYHKLIFDKFYQAEHQNIRKPKGTGLGLAICKKIIELHGGKITLKSELECGAEFIIFLPFLKEKE